jgi:hypothetical protein
LISAGNTVFMLQTIKGSSGIKENKDLERTLNLQMDDQSLKLEMQHADQIDYWEVDPAWDGSKFHSFNQAVRPRRIGTIPGHLDLPVLNAPSSICARVVDIHGNCCSLHQNK